MIDPYIAVALQTTVRHVTTRQEVERNLAHIGNMIDLVAHICSLELPVRLIALGEGASTLSLAQMMRQGPTTPRARGDGHFNAQTVKKSDSGGIDLRAKNRLHAPRQ